MLCYKDKTFCVAPCSNIGCDRRLTKEINAAADEWWGKPGAPVATSDYRSVCKEFQEDLP